MDKPHRTLDHPALPVRNVGEALAASLYFSVVDWTDRRLAGGLPVSDRAERADGAECPISVPDLMTAVEAFLAKPEAS